MTLHGDSRRAAADSGCLCQPLAVKRRCTEAMRVQQRTKVSVALSVC